MKRAAKKITFLLMLTFSMHLSYAQSNDDLFSKVLKQLHLSKDSIFNGYNDCIYPYSKNKAIAAFAKLTEKDKDGTSLYDAYVLLVDKNTGKILNKLYESQAIESDAIRFSDIAIDTTFYNVNNKDKAFGVLFEYTGSSRFNPMGETGLSLFIPEGKTFKRILYAYTIYEGHGEYGYEDCASNYNQTNTRSVTVDQEHSHHGFYDLIIKEKMINRTGVKDGCKVKKTIQHKITKLKYNGKEYTYKIN